MLTINLLKAPVIVADCGHRTILARKRQPMTTGYGTWTRDIIGTLCFACGTVAELAAAREDGRVGAYLSSDGRSITTWPGGFLGAVVRESTSRVTSRFGTRITTVRANIGGQMFCGRGAGRGMYISLRRVIGDGAGL